MKFTILKNRSQNDKLYIELPSIGVNHPINIANISVAKRYIRTSKCFEDDGEIGLMFISKQGKFVFFGVRFKNAFLETAHYIHTHGSTGTLANVNNAQYISPITVESIKEKTSSSRKREVSLVSYNALYDQILQEYNPHISTTTVTWEPQDI